METIPSLLAILIGLGLRLAIPVVVTALAVYFLRQLDARWQAETETAPLPVQKPECWKVQGCPPNKRATCPAYASDRPCWQVFRLPSGYLREECLTCRVFLKAPLPMHA